MSQTRIEALFALQLRTVKIPFVSEFVFCEQRRWRFDFAFPERKIAVEVEGGVWVQGRHNRGRGYSDDCHKYSIAAALGWTVLRFTARQIQTGLAYNLTRAVIERDTHMIGTCAKKSPAKRRG